MGNVELPFYLSVCHSEQMLCLSSTHSSLFLLPPQEIMPFLRSLRNHARHVEMKSEVDVVTADPTDNIFLECALDGGADFLISGDRHLLDIKVYKGIKIVRAREFLLREGSPHS